MPPLEGPQGVLASYNKKMARTIGEPFPIICKAPLRWADLHDTRTFFALPLAQRLGLPLIFMIYYREFDILTGDTQHNDAVALLSIECQEEANGKVAVRARRDVTFDAVLCRADGKNLEPQHVGSMVNFVQTQLGDVVALWKHTKKGKKADDVVEAELQEKARRAWNELATPETYKRFYEEMLREHPKDMEGVESPFAHGQSICKGCGETEGALMQCSGCKKVDYCSKECQKKDWKLHKSVFHRG